MKVKVSNSKIIAENRKAKFSYFIHDRFVAGIVLQGWEVKSLKAGRVQIIDSYIECYREEIWVCNLHITPLLSASTHVEVDSSRRRKLLMNKREINKINGIITQKNYTAVALSLFWAGKYVKLSFGTATGKKSYDKREALRKADWLAQKDKIKDI